MPMIWRTLFVIEELIKRGLDLEVSDFVYFYNLTTFGSRRFLFKIKSQRIPPILRTTQNGILWKRQFFFVDRGSVVGGWAAPSDWIPKVPGFSNLFTADDRAVVRIAHLLGLPEIDRTFGNPGSDSVETMSGTGKAIPRFGLKDIECHVESRAKKEVEQTEKAPAEEKPIGRVKMVKRKKEPDSRLSALFADRDFEGVGDMTFDILDMMFKKLRSDRQKMEKAVLKLEGENARIKAEVEVKEREMEVLRVDKEKEVAAAIKEAKDAASLAVMHAKIKMAKEAADSAFDRAAWNVHQWELFTKELMGDLERKAALVPRH